MDVLRDRNAKDHHLLQKDMDARITIEAKQGHQGSPLSPEGQGRQRSSSSLEGRQGSPSSSEGQVRQGQGRQRSPLRSEGQGHQVSPSSPG